MSRKSIAALVLGVLVCLGALPQLASYAQDVMIRPVPVISEADVRIREVPVPVTQRFNTVIGTEDGVFTVAVDPVVEEQRLNQRNTDLAVNRLVQEYAAAKDDAKRTELKSQLVKNLEEQFVAKQAARETELAQLEEQVKKLRERQAQRQAQKDRIINDRLQQLINDAQGLGWGSADAIPFREKTSSIPLGRGNLIQAPAKAVRPLPAKDPLTPLPAY